jgi:hypothetical protein
MTPHNVKLAASQFLEGRRSRRWLTAFQRLAVHRPSARPMRYSVLLSGEAQTANRVSEISIAERTESTAALTSSTRRLQAEIEWP